MSESVKARLGHCGRRTAYATAAAKGYRPQAWRSNQRAARSRKKGSAIRMEEQGGRIVPAAPHKPTTGGGGSDRLGLGNSEHNRMEAPRGLTCGLAPNDAGHLDTLHHTSIAKGYFIGGQT